jgi:hypothetical protein
MAYRRNMPLFRCNSFYPIRPPRRFYSNRMHAGFPLSPPPANFGSWLGIANCVGTFLTLVSIGRQIFLEVDILIYLEGFPSDRFRPMAKWRNILHEIDFVPACTVHSSTNYLLLPAHTLIRVFGSAYYLRIQICQFQTGDQNLSLISMRSAQSSNLTKSGFVALFTC